jgi:hypothetical protein
MADVKTGRVTNPRRLSSAEASDAHPATPSGVRAGKHYVHLGQCGHRVPCAIVDNEKWYLEPYPEAAVTIRPGVYKSGQVPFELPRVSRRSHAICELPAFLRLPNWGRICPVARQFVSCC